MDARMATPADAAEIVRLAGVMFESMGTAVEDRSWEHAGQQHVRDRLGRDLAVFVVDDPSRPGRLVASAGGTIAPRLPTQISHTGLAGYVQWVCTDEHHRGRGLGRSVLRALLAWYDGRGVWSVELHATPMAEALYRALGFDDPGPRALRRRR